MKTFIGTLAAAAALALAPPAQDHKQHPAGDKGGHQEHAREHAQEGGEQMTATEALRAGGGRIKRGAAIGSSPAADFAEVLRNPAKFAGRAVVVEGVVMRVCKKQGCWMQIMPRGGGVEGVRVTFDHKFFVPKDADGMKFKAEGTFAVKQLNEEEATHLEKEGARLRRDKDGEASEVTFAATGVELWK